MKEDSTNKQVSTTNRRDFLFGKAAIKAVQETLGEVLEFERTPSRSGERTPFGFDSVARQSAYWEQYSIRAMACEFELLFHLQQYSHSAAVATEAFQLIEELEDQLTVYRDHSEVSRINAIAGTETLEVEPQLFGLLEIALELYRETDGAFDITSAVLTQHWKFDQRSGALPDKAEIARALQDVGSNQIELNPATRTIRFTNSNVQINLGGIGKGYAIDRAATLIRQKGIEDFAIHGGQSSVRTVGRDRFTALNDAEGDSDSGWWIGVSHPVFPGVRLGQVRLKNQSLGTSGTGRQGFFHRGVRYGHIIDPRTGWPTSHFLSTTVIANSAAKSDALATAFYVMPLEQVAEFCQRHSDVKAILVSDPAQTAGKTRQPEIRSELLVQTFNIEDQDLLFEQLRDG